MNTLTKLKSNLINSLAGFRVLWREHSFRMECYVFAPLSIVIFALNISWTHKVIALMWMLLVLVVEGLNTALEVVCDRITREHDLAIKQAKDVASAAVMLTNVGLFFYVIWILFWA